MSLIETLTTRLGISIHTLTAFLRIHHSLLARYGTAKRTLPGTSLLKVAELYHLAEAAPPAQRAVTKKTATAA